MLSSTPRAGSSLLSASQVLLLERGKWTHNRLLRFVLDDVLGRRENKTLQAAAALLHRDSLLPGQGAPLLDSLDENSHKHAFAVSEDLKIRSARIHRTDRQRDHLVSAGETQGPSVRLG